MRLGVSTSFEFDSAESWIKKHRELGCKSVVFPLNCEADSSMIDEFAAAAKENDITIAEVGIWRNALSADPVEREAVFKYSVGQLVMADRIGAICCVNVAGTPHGPRWDGGYRGNFSAETRAELVKGIQRLIDEVKPVNTKYSVESMPWMVPSGPDDYLKLAEEVDRSGFGVHLDLINMVTSPERYFFLDEFIDECFDKLGDRVLSCHLKDIRLMEEYTFMLKECACGEGTLNIRHFIERAEAINPEMPFVIEHLSSDEAYRNSFQYVTGLLKID